MGTEIRYCDSCGKLISPAEVAGGRALVTPTGTVCPECLRALSLEQRAALEGRLSAGRAGAGAGANVARRRTGPGGTGSSPPVRRRSPVLPAAIGAGILVGIALALVVAKTGGRRGSDPGDLPQLLPGPIDVPPGPSAADNQGAGALAALPATTNASEPGAPRRRVDEIAAMMTPDLGRYDDMARALRRFPSEYPDAPEVAEAERLLRDLERRYDELADATLADGVRTAADLERAGEVDAAISIVRAVQARFGGSAWASARGDAEIQATLDRLLAARKERPPAVQPAPPGSMVVHWTFDDPAADATLMIVGADAGACTTDGLAGRALALDGLDDYAITPRPLTGRLADASCTFLVRFRPEGAGVLLSELGQPVPSDGWHVTVLEISPTGEVRGRLWEGLGPITLGVASMREWHVAVLRYDVASQRLTGFLDGRPATGTAVGPRKMCPAPCFAVGAADSQNLGNGGYLRGAVDEVRVYAGSLSDDVVAGLMDGGEAPAAAPGRRATSPEPPDGSLDGDPALVVHFTFDDDGQGGVVRNAAGAGTGQLKGTDVTPSWVEGKVGRSLRFEGRGDHVALSPMPAFAYGQGMTLALWMKLEPCEQTVIIDQAANDKYLSLSIGPDNRIRWEVGAGMFIFAEPIERGTWRHVAGTYDAATKTSALYIDGRLSGSMTYDAPTDYRGIPIYLCSRDGSANGIRGTLDDVRVYARALSAQEIAILHGQIDAQISEIARTPEERKRLLADTSASPEREGYVLSLQTLANLARSYDPARVTPKRIAAIGGALAASSGFDSELRKELTPAAGYAFAGRLGLASRSLTTDRILARLGANLEREKPEFVRILPDVAEVVRDGSAARLRGNLVSICEAVLEAGGVPVLVTLPIMDGTGDERVDAIVRSCNDAIREAARAARVPCVDASAYLNRDGDAKRRSFDARGGPAKAGMAELGERTLALYRALERWVMKRDER